MVAIDFVVHERNDRSRFLQRDVVSQRLAARAYVHQNQWLFAELSGLDVQFGLQVTELQRASDPSVHSRERSKVAYPCGGFATIISRNCFRVIDLENDPAATP